MAARFAKLVLVLVASGSSALAQDRDTTFEEAKAALLDWRRSLVTLRLKTETKLVRSTDPDAKIGSAFEDDWIWTDDGRWRWHRVSRFGDGTIGARSLTLSNGKIFAEAKYPKGPSDETRPTEVFVSPQNGPDRGSLSFEPLFGLWSNRDGCWLPDLLPEEGRVVSDGTEDFEGVRCPRINVFAKDRQSVEEILLDPRHGFLPRRTRLGSRFVVFSSELSEFHEMVPGVPLGWLGIFRSEVTGQPHGNYLSEQECRVLKAEANGSLPPELFEPPLGPGTRVADARTGTVVVAGAKTHWGQVEADLAERARRNVAAGSPVEAEPPLDWTMWAGIGLGVAAAIAIGTSTYLRRG